MKWYARQPCPPVTSCNVDPASNTLAWAPNRNVSRVGEWRHHWLQPYIYYYSLGKLLLPERPVQQPLRSWGSERPLSWPLPSLVPRPFLSLKKKNAEKSGGRVWANGLLLGVARAGMQPWALMREKHLQLEAFIEHLPRAPRPYFIVWVRSQWSGSD